MVRNLLMVIPVALAVGSTTACASKGFVRSSVTEVNDKVDSLGRSVEQTQERTRQNEGRIGEVDQKAAAANTAAAAAQTSANRAGEAANAAANTAATATARADALDKASKRIIFEVVLSEDQGNFKFGKHDLPEEAATRLDQMVTEMKADPKGAFFEIEGHTDSIGTKELNNKLGLERAEAVKRYLYEKHQIPLHKMNVISYGMDKPIAPNKTRVGRAQNRRVVIRVLA